MEYNKAQVTITLDNLTLARTILAETKGYRDDARTLYGNTVVSEANASDSQSKAKQSEINAKSSEEKAKASELNAKASETKSKASEINAKTSEDNAKVSENKAKVSETNAKTSEDNSKASELVCIAKANIATEQASIAVSNASITTANATNARRSEENALQSETNARNSASSASASATSASNSAAICQNIVSQAVDAVRGELGDVYSTSVLKADEAADSARSASSSASTATTQAGIATNKATEANNKLTEATAQAELAKGYAEDAQASADRAMSTTPTGYEQLLETVSTQSSENVKQNDDIALLNRKVSALEQLNEGVSYRFETDSTEAYSKVVPSGARAFDLKMLGGKSIVANQKFNISKNNITAFDSTLQKNVETNTLTLTCLGNSSANRNIIQFLDSGKQDEHKYYVTVLIKNNSSNDRNFSLMFNAANVATFSCTANSTIKAKHIAIYNYNYGFRVQTSTELKKGDVFEISNVQIIDLTQMFGSGNEPTIEEFEAMFPNYIPYTEPTIVSQSVENVKVRGKNLCKINGFSTSAINNQQNNLVNTNTYGTTIQTQGDKVVVTQSQTPNTTSSTHYSNGYFCVAVDTSKLVKGKTYCFSCDVTPTKIPLTIQYLPILPNGSNGQSTSLLNLKLNEKNKIKVKNVIWNTNETGTLSYFEIRIGGMSGIWENFMITEAEDSNYSPYTEQNIPIPTEITDQLDCYGAGINGVYNALSWCSNENKDLKASYSQRVLEEIFNGTEYWFAQTNKNGIKYFNTTRTKKIKLTSLNMVCAEYQTIAYGYANATEYSGVIAVQSDGLTIVIIEKSEMTVEQFKAKLQSKPLKVVYELAEPIITDISDLLDNRFEAISCEANGTITFEGSNENYHLPVPNEEEFVVKLSEV